MNVHKPLHASAHTHTFHRAVGLLCNLSHSFSGEKYVLSFHFISFFCAPSLPPLSHSATCSPPQTPVLKSQATSCALTAAPCFWRCDSVRVCHLRVCVLVLLYLCRAIFCFKPVLLGHICFVRKFSPHKRTTKQWTQTRLKWSQSKAFYLKVKHSYWAWELNKCCSVVFPLFALIWFLCVPNNSCKFCH